MGTNYYLQRKMVYDERRPLPASLGCTITRESEIRKLSNGWLWNDAYYPTLDELNKNLYQLIHIGKSSCGWRFLLCTYPTENPRFRDSPYRREYYLDQPIASLEDWARLFRDPNNRIINSCDETVSAQKMLEIITERKPHSNIQEGWQQFPDHDTWYRGQDGLFVHDSSRDPIFASHSNTTIMPKGHTYDLILSGNDIESGSIFS